MTKLLESLQLGSIEAKNRIFMAPLTRGRADRQHVPTSLMVEYYAQRATSGLIISEATGISQEGLGWPFAPGIWNSAQVEGWKPVTKAVHEKGGKIVAQLWHMGRTVHSNVTGVQPVSSSPTTFPAKVHTYDGKLDPEQARELTKEDISRIVKEYAVAAKNAIEAGFDGVQVHAANGYLIEEFLKDSGNFRKDEYGGSIENRTRFLEEAIESVVDAIGAQRTSVRLSPNGETYGVIDSDPEPLYRHVATVLNKYGLAFVELREAGPEGTFLKTDQPKLHSIFRENYKGVLGLNQDFDRKSAIEIVENGTADFVSFGRAFIANPDLVQRIKEEKSWNAPDFKTFYSQGPKGYTDYATLGKL